MGGGGGGVQNFQKISKFPNYMQVLQGFILILKLNWYLGVFLDHPVCQRNFHPIKRDLSSYQEGSRGISSIIKQTEGDIVLS